jgi:hypothetical protein
VVDNKYIHSKIDFVMLSFLIMASISLAILAYSFGGVDFGVYYAAGSVFLKGGNPYDYNQLALEIVSSTGDTNNPYYYAPWFTWAVSPLALLPYDAARILWAAINFALWFWGLLNLSNLIEWHPIGWRRWGVYLFSTFVFAWATWGSEQVGILIFFMFTLVLLSEKRAEWLSMGIWMALLLFKPNITVFPVAALSIWLILRRKWIPVISMTGALTIMIVVSLFLSPGWHLELLKPDKIVGLSYTLNPSGEIQIVRFTTTMLDWLATFGVGGNAARGLYTIVIITGIIWMVFLVLKSRSITELLAMTVLINFAVIPYALFYDYPTLTLTLFFINTEFLRKSAPGWAQVLMNGLVLASLFVGNHIAYRYWIVVILLVFSVISRVIALAGNKSG